MAKFGIKQSDFSKGLTVTGSLVTTGSVTVIGPLNVTGGITGSTFGTSSYATSASYAISASTSHLLDSYPISAFPRLAISNTFTADQQVVISGSKEIGTFEGDTFFILDTISNAEIGLSNALSDFDGPFTAGIYVSSGSTFSTSSYRTAIEIPNGANFPSGGLVSIKFPTNITGSLIVTNGASGSFSGSFAGDGSGITNISASSVVGLNLSQIASGSYTASIGANGFQVNTSASISGSLNVRDTITATTLVVQTITSSVDFVTGSTRFGTLLSNTHQFTGSVSITGSLAVNGVDYEATSASFSNRILNNSSSIGLLSSSFLNASASFNTRILNNSSSIGLLSSSFLNASASFNTRILSDSGSIAALSASFLSFSGSFNTGSFTGSFRGQFTGSFSGSLANLQGTQTYIPFFSSSQVLANSSIYQVNTASIAINQTNITTANPEALYVSQTHPTSINVISGKGNLDNYLQLNIFNTNQGPSASSDIVATANNGDEFSNYIDMGINSENYAQNFIGGPNDAYIYSTGNDLHIGNATPNKPLQLFVGGTDVDAYVKLQLNPNNQHQMSGSLNVSGSIRAVSFTGSLQGIATTASYVLNAESASYALSASNAQTASYVLNGVSASYALSASNALTASFAVRGIGSFSGSFSGSFAGDGSGLTNISASSVVGLNLSRIVSGSATASISPTEGFTVNTNTTISGSTLISGSLTVTGSTNLFGGVGTIFSANVDTMVFTGSLFQSGSIDVNGRINATSITSSLLGTASYAAQALTASNANTASYVLNGISSSYALSASNAQTASYVLQAVSSSFATTASSADNFIVRGTLTAQTIVAQFITSSTEFITGSTRFGSDLTNTHQFTGSVSITGSLTSPNTTGSLFGTASWASNAITASNAVTASYVLNAESASYALSASNAQTSSYVLNAESASYALSASNAQTASYILNAVSASFALSASNAQTASFVLNGVSASYALSASHALTASFVPTGSLVGNFFAQGGNSFGTQALLGTNDAQNLALETNGTIRMTISGSGAIGINTITPANTLDVNGTARIQSSAYFATAAGSVGIGTTNPTGRLTIQRASTGASTDIDFLNEAGQGPKAKIRFGGTAEELSFWTGGTASERMRIASDGNVGIGTTSPSSLLNISSSTAASLLRIDSAAGAGTLFVSSSGLVGIGTTAPSFSLDVNGTGRFQNTLTVGITGTPGIINVVRANTGTTIGSFRAESSGNGLIITGGASTLWFNNSFNNTIATSQVNLGAMFGIRGSGSASTTTALLVQNSTTSASFAVLDDRSVIMYGGSTTSGSALITGSLTLIGNQIITGSSTATLGYTGSLFGTASWANNATTASYILNAISASYALSASNAQTASYILNAVSASSAVRAVTASYADNFTVAGTLTAQTIVVQTITSSQEFVTGSTKFGSSLSNTHQFTGSVSITGSLTVDGPATINNLTGSLFGTASWANNATTASYALSSSYAMSSSYALSASYAMSSSYAISSSFAQTASYVNPLRQTLIMSGAIDLTPTIDPDPTGANLTDTYLFVSKSNTALGNDLYFRQDGNLVKWKWIEGGSLNTGVLFGGVVTYSGSFVYVSSGSGLIVDYNANTGSEINPLINYVNWGPITQSIANITSSQVTYLYINSAGALQQQSIPFTPQQYSTDLPLGAVGHFNKQSISAFGGLRSTSYGQPDQANQFIDAFGPLKVSGYTITGITGSLSVSVGSGTSFQHGGFYQNDPNYPSLFDSPSVATGSIVRCYVSGSTTIFDTNNNNLYTTVNPGFYNDTTTGVTSSLGNNIWTIQRVFSYAPSNTLYVYYGQSSYATLTLALDGIAADPFVEGSTKDFTTFIGYLVLKTNTTDINSTDNKIVGAGLFRSSGAGSGGGAISVTSLNDLSDVTITSPVNNQALIYNSGIWINGNPTSASYAISASYAVSSSFTTTASFALNAISASYTLQANTASYILNAVSASYALSASHALTASFIANNITGSGAANQVAFFSGTNNVTSSATLAFTPTSQLLVNNSVTAAGAIARGINATPTLTAAANNDVLVGLDINPTFTNGAFTGVSNIALRTTGNVSISGTAIADQIQLGASSTTLTNSTGKSFYGKGSSNANFPGMIYQGVSVSDMYFGRAANSDDLIISTANIAIVNERIRFKQNGNVLIGTAADGGFRLDVNGTARVQGLLTVSTGGASITGSLVVAPSGTPEFQVASTGVTIGNVTTDVHTVTGSLNVSGSSAITGPLTANNLTGSLFGTASWANNATSASFATRAITASYADNFTVAGTLTAQTIVVQTITSSVDFVTGSTRFGSSLSNTHQFTGSVSITGSLVVDGPATLNNLTGSLFGTASWANNAITASNAVTASYILNAISASYALSASNAQTASFVLNGVSASYALSASNAQTASFILNAISASYALSASNAQTASFVLNSVSASFASTASFVPGYVSGSGTSGQVAYWNGTNTQTGNNNLFWDNTNGRLGIGTTSPSRTLIVAGGSIGITSDFNGLYFPNGSVFSGGGTFRLQNGTNYYDITNSNVQYWVTSNVERMRLFSTGHLVIGSSTDSGFRLDIATSGTSGSFRSIGTSVVSGSLITTGSLTLIGNEIITGSSTATLGYTGSLFGTASWASNATTSSYVLNAISASYALSASNALTASFVLNGVSASYALSASNAQTASFVLNAVTASYVLNAISSSYALSASNAQTASFVLNAVTASYVLNAISASYALSASNAQTASFVLNAISASYALSASNAQTASFVNTLNQNVVITNILAVGTSSIGSNENALVIGTFSTANTGEGGQILLQASGGLWTSASMLDVYQNRLRVLRGTNVSSDAEFASVNLHNGQVAFNKYTGSGAFTGTAVASLAIDASGNVITIAAGASTSASFATTASFAFTSSFASNAISSSYALSASNAQTASFVVNAVSASFASTASFAASGFTIGISQIQTATVASSIAGANNLFTTPTGSFTGAKYLYTVSSGSNARIGEVFAVWNGGTAQFTDISTLDIGTTTGVTASVSIVSAQAQLNLQTNTSGWNIKSQATFI